jgi:adenosylcobyric acid synthase
VRPFKPQNMSNNAAVTEDGGEIGRAQALQARACGIRPATDMNPVLLKPQSDGTAQLVICGRVHGTLSARDYRAAAPSLLPQLHAAFHRLAAAADLVLVEGAGSPAEINLRAGDIANMGCRGRRCASRWLATSEGGVIASCWHPRCCHPPSRRASSFIVNKFRGDPRLFNGGIAAIGDRTSLTCFGVVPCFPRRMLPAEDTMSLSRTTGGCQRSEGG